MSHRNQIDKWPTLAEFAEDIGVSENTAKQMRTRDSVRHDYWQCMVDAAKRREIEGVTLEALVDSAPKRGVAA